MGEKMRNMLYSKALGIIRDPSLSKWEKENNAELTATIQVYIAEGFDLNVVHRKTTLLCEISKAGLEKRLHILLEAGADPDMAETHGCSPLYLASTYGHDQVVRKLLDNGANTEKASRGLTPLHICIHKFRYKVEHGDYEPGYLRCVTLLLHSGARVNHNYHKCNFQENVACRITWRKSRNHGDIFTILDQLDFRCIPFCRIDAGHFTRDVLCRVLIEMCSLFLDAGTLLDHGPPPAFEHISALLTLDTVLLAEDLLEKFNQAGFPSSSCTFEICRAWDDERELMQVMGIYANGLEYGVREGYVKYKQRNLFEMCVINIRHCLVVSNAEGSFQDRIKALGLPPGIIDAFELKQF